MRERGRKGISTVVATVLIILITVAAVAIVWTAVIPMIKKQTEESTKFSEADVAIETSEGYTYYDSDRNLVSIQVRNTGKEKMEKIKIILENTYGNTYSFTQDFNAEKNQLKTFVLPVSEKPTKVSVAPVLVENKKEIEKEISSFVELKQGSSIGDIQFSGVYQGLISWWKFENTSNIGKDSVGNNNGIVYGGVNSSEGRNGIGKSASFDGVDDYINYSSTNLGNIQFSISLWINRKGNVNYYVPLVEQGGTKRFRLIEMSTSRVCLGNDSNTNNYYCTASNVIPDKSVWYHLVAFNDGVNHVFVNGVEYPLVQTNGTYGSWGTNQLNIAYRPYSSFVGPFNGSIDEVMIYNKSLGAEEVQELYLL